MRRIAAILLMALALVSCGGGKDSGGAADMPVLYRTVPSDALALVYGKRASDVLAYWDSTSVLHRLQLGNLSKSGAVLSVNYVAGIVPALSVELGRQTDSSLVRQAESLGLVCRNFSFDEEHKVLVVTPSEPVLRSIGRHIAEGASIADADCFDDVLAASRKGGDVIAARASDAAKFIPKSFLSKYLPRRGTLDFIKKLSKWVVLTGDADEMRTEFVTGVSGSYFSTVLDSLKAAPCKLDEVLPASTEFAVDLPLESVARFRREYERFLDANVGLDCYRDTLAVVKKRCGRSPLSWEGDLNVREVARVVTDSLSVLLVRPDRKPRASDLQPNPFRGFIPALYGEAFNIDDNFFAPFGKWLVYGSEEDVRRFLGTQAGKFSLPSKCKALCLTGDWTMLVGENGNRIEFKR